MPSRQVKLCASPGMQGQVYSWTRMPFKPIWNAPLNTSWGWGQRLGLKMYLFFYYFVKLMGVFYQTDQSKEHFCFKHVYRKFKKFASLAADATCWSCHTVYRYNTENILYQYIFKYKWWFFGQVFLNTLGDYLNRNMHRKVC